MLGTESNCKYHRPPVGLHVFDIGYYWIIRAPILIMVISTIIARGTQ